jgi:hypothetical protein
MVSSGNGTAVLFGHAGTFDPVSDPDNLDGGDGFIIGGLGTVGAGDINGDGFDDMIAGFANASGETRSMVVFGHAGPFDPTFDASDIDGTNGFLIQTDGASVSSGGDVNGDGYTDLLVASAGSTYVVFGHAGLFDADLDLNSLTPSEGFKLNPVDGGLGSVSAAGDINGDGYADLAIGGGAAAVYVLFGADFTGSVHSGNTGTVAGENFVGTNKADVINGGGGKDSIESGSGDDEIHVTDNAFRHVDGGNGTDTLHLDYAGAIDFGNLDGDGGTSDRGKLSGVETISIDNGKANALTLHLADVLDIDADNRDVGGNPNLDNVLKIDGNAGDTFHLAVTDGWGAADTASLAGYAVYTNQGVHIAVEATIAVTVT